ncbi:MAG: T9SS type A sorting domain-containing protein, partial [Bacteroidetes bacterium]|nr:T9SS type A sorting domain-containing protein [Bacteroidota bacterium]
MFSIAFSFFFLLLSSKGQVRFNRLFSSEVNEICQNVIVVNDGYIICTGTDTSGWRCFRLIKTDLEGNVVWNRKYGNPGERYYEGWENSLFSITDNNFILIGSHYPNPDNMHKRPFIAIFDSEGDSVLFRFYEFGLTRQSGYHGIITDDGGYAITGQYFEYTDSTMEDYSLGDAYLLKLDSAYNFEWYRNYGGNDYDATVKVVQTSDGGYMLGGMTYSYSSSRDWYIVKTDSLGNEEWHKILGSSYYDLEIKGMIRTMDGNIVVTGERTLYFNNSTGYREYNARILKINNSDSIIWDKEYSVYYDVAEPNDTSYGIFFSLIELPNQDIALMCKGKTQFGSDLRSKSILFKLNSIGDSIWTRRFHYPNYDFQDYDAILDVLKPTADGGFIMAGWTEHNYLTPMQQVWLVKTDSLGWDGTFIREYRQPAITVEVYPNPTSGSFTIYLISEKAEHTVHTYILYNLVGQQVSAGSMNERVMKQVDITDQPSGIYLLTIEKNGRVVFGTKVIKR